jgi:hypothetical protein
MSKASTIPRGNGEAAESVTGRDSPSATSFRSLSLDGGNHVTELELENSRLHRLVAELLIKNQQLRRQSEAQS